LAIKKNKQINETFFSQAVCLASGAIRSLETLNIQNKLPCSCDSFLFLHRDGEKEKSGGKKVFFRPSFWFFPPFFFFSCF
jgi:hypothetical protein